MQFKIPESPFLPQQAPPLLVRIPFAAVFQELITGLVAQTAELFVVDELMNRGPGAAHRAIGITAEFERIDLHSERVETQQPADQVIAFAEDQFDRLQSFDDAD